MKKKKKELPEVVMKQWEARQMLGVCYSTMWKMVRAGDVPTVKIGERLYILREPFMKLFNDPERRRRA